MPDAILSIAFPLALAAWGAAVHAAVTEANGQSRSLSLGRIAWFSLAACSASLAFLSRADWMHLLWSVHFPMQGLAVSSGLLLATAPSRGVERASGSPRCLPLCLFATLLGLGALPFVMLLARGDLEPTARAGGSLIGALGEVFHYGFGGPIPPSMAPEHAEQLARGLGSPVRDITVSMCALRDGALWAAILAIVVLVTAPIRAHQHRNFLSFSLPMLAVAALYWLGGDWWGDESGWRNEPSYVRSFGPILLAAAVLVPLALVVSARARSSPPQSAPSRSSSSSSASAVTAHSG